MELRIAHLSDVGRVREDNEDSVLTDALPLVAVADGMGGHEGGEVASKLALEQLKGWRDRLAASEEVSGQLREAFGDAHRAVFDRGRAEQNLAGMGTTLTAGWIEDDKMTLAHVGDSRAYLLRGGKLRQLTQDQTVAQEWVRRGRLSEDEAATSPHRHILLQAIGADTDDLDIEMGSVQLRSGDRILLASDGLYGMVHDADEIRDLLVRNVDPDEACRALVEAANTAGGEDNVSVVIVDVDGGPLAVSDEDDQVVVERLEAPKKQPDKVEPSVPEPRSRVLRRVLLGVAALVVVGVVVVVFLASSTTTLLVSARGGSIVVLEGRPGDDDSAATGKVVRRYPDEPVDQFPSPTRRQLRSGIVVESLEDAERVIERLNRTLGPQQTPTPQPTTTPEGSPRPSPDVTPLDA
jgi:serine/threonine protein phosphatase PrpC